MKKAILTIALLVLFGSNTFSQTVNHGNTIKDNYKLVPFKGYNKDDLKIVGDAFTINHPDIKLSLEWESPNFKLVTSDCKNNKDIKKLRKSLLKESPNSTIELCND